VRYPPVAACWLLAPLPRARGWPALTLYSADPRPPRMRISHLLLVAMLVAVVAVAAVPVEDKGDDKVRTRRA